MNIIFDREACASWGKNDPANTPELLVARREESLRILGEFMHADSVEYLDLHKQEHYIIRRGEETLLLSALGNQCDGGWLSIETKRDEKGLSFEDMI